MTMTILFIAFSLGATQQDKPVTDAEKKEFLAVLAKLPTQGEFFADEGVTFRM